MGGQHHTIQVNLMNKKAEQLKFMYLVLWAFMLAVILVIISFFTSAFLREALDIRDAEARLVLNRILYSPTGISYYDKDLGRNYPGTVDLQKLDSAYLDKALKMEENQNKMISARINVKSTAGEVSKTAMFNELWYERWLPLAGKKGSGGTSWASEFRYVSIYDGDEFKGPGVVEISVLMPNG